MGRITTITAAACATVLLGAAAATAQPADRTTYVTFSGPVSVPGKTLPAGTYTFRLADSPADRHIVQIFDRDQSQLFATLLAVPAERNQLDGEPLITFKETPADRPPALHYWYYAGDRAGNEFVYPKAQAMMIARSSGEGVMAVDTEGTDVKDWKGTPTRVTADAEPTTAAGATAATTTTGSEPTAAATGVQPAPTAQPTTAAPATTAPPMVPAPATSTAQDQAALTAAPQETAGTSGRTARTELPHTAGELPAVGLIALFALTGAFALRMARKATA